MKHLYFHVSYKSISQSELNKDLQAISNWGSHWKVQFNPGPNQQEQEAYFSKKVNNISSHPETTNNTKVVTCPSQKHSGLVLDQQLKLKDHIKVKWLNVLRWLVLLKDYR